MESICDGAESTPGSTVNRSSGSQTTISASKPAASLPFLSSSPASFAGASDISRDQITESKPSGLKIGPHYRKAELQCRYPAPGIHEVARILSFERRCTRRMVGNDHVDRAVGNGLPEFLAVFPLTHRGTAFKMRVPSPIFSAANVR